MKEADRPILRVLHEANFPKRASSIRWVLSEFYDIDIAESTFYRRLKNLRHAGLIEKTDSYYSLSDLGEKLLNDELSDDEISEISELLQEGPPDGD